MLVLAHFISEAQGTAMRQLFWHMGHSNITDQLWSPRELGHHQVTSYGFLMTTKDHAKKFMRIDVCEEGGGEKEGMQIRRSRPEANR